MTFLKQKRVLAAMMFSGMVFCGSFVSATAQETNQIKPLTGFEAIPEQTPEKKAEPVIPKRRFAENFNGDDRTLMLGGQLNFNFPHSSKMTWNTNIFGGKFIMENRTQTGNLYYDEITWVRYDGEDTVSSTENAIISVTVEAMNEGHGAAGILVGSGPKGYYLMFGVDKEGRYHVLQKTGSKTMPVYSGADDAIRRGQANRLHHEMRGESIVFFANNKELISIPFDQRKPKGIALATFGLGTYSFDDVEIIAGKVVPETFEKREIKLIPRFKTSPSGTF